MPRYTFTYPSVLEAGSSMYDHVLEVMESNQVAAQDSHRSLQVISEAFTNAYLHGNEECPEKRIIVSLSINEAWISADIIDEGQNGWKRVREMISGTPKLPAADSESGRGIALMKHFAANLSFAQTSSGGLKVTFRMKRNEPANMEKSN